MIGSESICCLLFHFCYYL